MSVQVRRRREAASFLATFVGAQGELIVDTTNNRVQVHDGATPGGFPTAKLADVAQRTAVADAACTALATDRTIAFTALTTARAVQLPAASAYPVGTQLLVVDESGACSATSTITLNRAGTDTINGAASAVIALPYGFIALNGNGAGKWTVVDQATASMAQQTASNVAITGGTAALTTLTLKSTASNLAAQGTAIFGAVDSVTRYAAFDTFGRITWRFDDNGYVSGPTLNNFALTAAGQGADALKVNLGTGGSLVATAGTIRLATTDAFTSTATASAKWQFYAATASTLGIGLEVSGTFAATPLLRLSQSYTVATLPAPGAAGRVVFCSNARMQTTTAGALEAAGAGTGGLVTDNGSAWKIAGTNITALA